jgi:hypothetical protein
VKFFFMELRISRRPWHDGEILAFSSPLFDRAPCGGGGRLSSSKESSYTGQHSTDKRLHTLVSLVGFEPTILVFRGDITR